MLEAAKTQVEDEKNRLALLLQRQKELIECIGGKSSSNAANGNDLGSFTSSKRPESAVGETHCGGSEIEDDHVYFSE